MIHMSRRFSIAVGLLFVLLAIAYSSAEPEPRNLPADWVREFENGGVLHLRTLDSMESINMNVSSRLPDNATVLRGFSAEGTGAILLVSPTLVSGSINDASGTMYRFRIDITGHASTPFYDPLLSMYTVDPLQAGPIRVWDEFSAMPSGARMSDAEDREDGFCNERCRELYSSDELTSVHITPFGGHSIRIGKHIYDGNTAIDPINVIFYGDDLDYSLAHHTVETNEFESTSCGSNKYAYFYDDAVGHSGGSDEWELQEEGADRHYQAVFTGGDCVDRARAHIRFYESDSGDTHNPGFGPYILAPTHFETAGHDPEQDVNPQTGQDILYSLIAEDHHVAKISTYSTTPGNCASCGKWSGVLDLYEIGDATTNTNAAGVHTGVKPVPQSCGLAGPVSTGILSGGSYVSFSCNDPTRGIL